MSEENLTYDLGVNVPYSVEAEQSVLGALLVDPQCILDVAPVVKPEFFYLPQHRHIYTAIITMFDLNKQIDFVSLLERLKSDKVYDEAGGKAYLTQLVQVVPSSANVMTYVGIVKEKYYTRSLLNAAQGIIKDVNESGADSNKLIDSAEQRIYDIRAGRETEGLKLLKTVIETETFDRLTKMNNAETSALYKGIPTGIKELDYKISGLNRSDLIILGARPGMGKTSFALNIATHVAMKENRKVCFFSLEMSRDQLAQRVLSSESGVDSEKLRNGNLQSPDWVALGDAGERLSHANFFIDETAGITVPEMKAKIRRLGNVDLVIVDYLGLMHSARRIDNRVQEISEITRSLKVMAKELQIPVIVCSQLSRATEVRGKSHKPGLADLRDSGSIEQDADIVLFLYRDEYYNNDTENGDVAVPGKAECIIAKNRHGSIGSIELHWDGKLTRYTSVEKMR